MIAKTICFSNPVYLSQKNGQLIIKYPDDTKDIVSLPIEDLGVVILDCQQITITHSLIEHLLDNKCALITCDSRHMPNGLMLSLYSNTLCQERFVNQIESSIPLRKQLWQQTIQSKIRNQGILLNQATKYEHKCMLNWSKKVKSGDPDNLEGRAAVYYWKNLFVDNPNFIRDQDGDGINSLLNYGYAIVRAVIARALSCSGLLPTLGIHHHNRYNAYCLADDVMEPYRPYVDKKVIEICNSTMQLELSPVIKKELLQIPTMDVVIDGIRHPLIIGASITASSLEKCFSGEKRKILYTEIKP